jgi:tryptophan 2,3-dioxygenase
MSFEKSGTGESDYERYIRTQELLSLQKRVDQLANDDELFFQSIHQAMELWMKVANFELVKITRYLDGDHLQRAAHHLNRVARILDHLSAALPIMETMAQADYHEIRLALGRGSGQDSPGFNHILEALPAMWAPFARALERHGIAEVITIFKEPHKPPNEQLYYVAQAFIEVDKCFQQFRYVHLQMARREIGLAVKSLKGVPARNLEQGVLKAAFPELWKAIEDLTIATNPVYG